MRYRINKHFSMAKIYSKRKLASKKLLPKKETLQFLLNYSKALNIIKIGNMKLETIAN